MNRVTTSHSPAPIGSKVESGDAAESLNTSDIGVADNLCVLKHL